MAGPYVAAADIIPALNGANLSDRNAIEISIGLAPSYLGQVATRCFMPRNLMTAGAGRWQMTSKAHQATDYIINPTLIMPNWRVANDVESSPGAGTLNLSIECPLGSGIYYQAVECAAASGGDAAFPAGNVAFTFTGLVIIPGTWFGSRHLQKNASGTVFVQYQSNYCSHPYDGWESGTGAVSNKVMTGTVSSNVIDYGPIAILSMTRKASFVAVEDSRGEGGTAGVNDASYLCGQAIKSLGRYFGVISLNEAATTLSGYLAATRTYRDQLFQYVTHVLSGRGINDLGTGGTAAALVTSRAAFAALYSTKTVIGITLPPYIGTTDGFYTAANQNAAGTNNVKVMAFNDTCRAGITGEAFVWDIAKIFDPFKTGKYPVTRNANDNTVAGSQGQVTASISGTTMTITATTVAVKVGDFLTNALNGTGITIQPGTYITAIGTYNGTSGTVTVSKSQTLASGTLYSSGYVSIDGLHWNQLGDDMIADSPITANVIERCRRAA